MTRCLLHRSIPRSQWKIVLPRLLAHGGILVLLVVTVGALGACLDNGVPPFTPKFDHGVIPPDVAHETSLPSPILELGNIPSITCGDEVGVVGRATPGVTIIVQGGAAASGVVGSASPTDGRFCVPVTLRPGQVNNLQVLAQDPTRGLSKPAMVAVRQDDCTGNGEFKDAGVNDAGEPSRNVALGVVGKSKEPPVKGNLGFLTDGKTTDWIMWKGSKNWYCGWCDYGGWVMLTLEQLYEVEKIVVMWRDHKGTGNDYGKEYQVLYTAISEPPDPNLDDGYWSVAKAFTEGEGGIDTIDLKSIGNPLIRHVALWFQQDARSYITESGTFGTIDESFAITEIEIYNRPKKSGPPPTPPGVCQGF
ncbi:MAG: hypothetical protein KAI47_04815 [Deltaproteobacteria bacterium]|nr:hypothetical protein [Deltaproteobacteria bacterium]